MAFGAKIQLTVNKTASAATAFRRDIQILVNQAVANNPIKIKIHPTIADPKNQLKSFRDQFNSSGGITGVKLKDIDSSGAIKKLRSDIQTMLRGLNIVGLKDFLNAGDADGAVKGIQEAKKESAEWAAQMRIVDDIQKRLGSTYKSSLSGRQMVGDATQVNEITAAYTAWQVKVEELRNTKVALSAEELQALQQEGIALQQKITLIQEEQVATASADAEKKRAAAQEEVAARKQLALAQQRISLKSQVQRYIMSNSRAYKAYGAELDGIMHQLTTESSLTDAQLRQIRMRFYEIQSSARAAGMSGNTFFDTMKKGFAKFGGWSIITRTLMAVYRIFTNMITAVKELDAAMTELRKVTELSERSYREYLNTAEQLSQQIGATLADTVNATADFARLGYSIADSTALAEAALVYKNVGDGIDDIATASESLISTIKAFEQFGESANNAMSIIDRFNEVGNNFAISSEGIGSALQRSASSLASAGNTLNQSIALVTGMNAVVQDPDKVGTALKTISMYLRAAKTEAEEAGESTEGMANSVSELRSELLTLTKGRVDIMLDDKTFKSTYEIMKDLSEVWNDLADIDQANILELIGGKRNANAVTSLLTNFQDAENALQTAAQSYGSALAENEKYLGSIAGKLSIFQSKFETFSNNLINSGVVKFVVELGSFLLTILDGLQRIHLLIPLIAVSTAVIMGQLNANKMATIVQQILLQKNAIISEKGASDQLAVSLAGLNAQQRKLLVTELDRAVEGELLEATMRDQIVSALGLAGAEGTLSAANKGLATSFKSLAASVPVWGWIALAISVVIDAVIGLSDLLGGIETPDEKISRLNDEFEQLNSTITNTASKFRNLVKSANEIIPRFVELVKGVSSDGKNVSLTNEEYDEFLSLNNQIAEMFPELNLGMDSNGNAMLSLSYASDTLSKSLWGLVEAQREAANEEIADTMPDVLKKLKETTKAYNQAIDEISVSKEALDDAYILVRNQGNTFTHSETDSTSTTGMNRLNYINALSRLGISWTETKRESDDIYESTLLDLVADFSPYELYSIYQSKVSALDHQIGELNEDLKKSWNSGLGSVVTAWLTTDTAYDNLDEETQDILSRVVGAIDFSDKGKYTKDEITKYIQDNYIRPVEDLSIEGREKLHDLTNLPDLWESGAMDSGAFIQSSRRLLSDLEDAGIGDEFRNALSEMVGVESIEQSLNQAKDLLKNEFRDMAEGLNRDQLGAIEYVYQIFPGRNSMTWEELLSAIDAAKLATASYVDVLDFTDTKSSMDEIADSVDNIVSMMDKLRQGTLLTKKELVNLAMEYPNLLSVSNLFTEGTIESQEQLLDAVLHTYEQQYKGQIQTKIKELEATKELVQEQIDLEYQKSDILRDIRRFTADGTLDANEDLNGKLSDLNALQVRNVVTVQDGVLKANTEALKKKLSAEGDALTASVTENWAPYATKVVEVNNSAYRLTIDGMQEWLETQEVYISANAHQRQQLEKKFLGILKDNEEDIKNSISNEYTGKDVRGIDVTFKDLDGTTFSSDDYQLSQWVDNQDTWINTTIDSLQDYLGNLDVQIKNLYSLMDFDLSELIGSGSSGSGKDTEEYLADIDQFYEAVKKLEEVQRKKQSIERQLENTEDPLSKLSLEQDLIQSYKDEADAERDLIGLRSDVIAKNAEALRKLGFEIEYNNDTHKFFIKNLEHLNELTATSQGEYDSMQEATNALRKETEELIDTTEDLNDANIDSVENIEELTYSMLESKDDILSYIEEIYEKQIDAYQEIIDLRKEAIEAARDELSYEDEVAEKVREIADLQARIDKLSLDDSREAQAQRAELLEELNEKNKELEETQSDHAYDAQIDSLDKMAENYETEKTNDLEIIRSSIDASEQAWREFYDVIIGRTSDVGYSVTQDVVNVWLRAAQSVRDYGDAVSGVTGVTSIVGTVPKFHTGGVVGSGNINKEEVLAVLQSGEVVLNDDMQDSLYEIVDFQTEFSKQLGTQIGKIDLSSASLYPTMNLPSIDPYISEGTSNWTFEPHISVTIAHTGEMTSGDATRYGEQIANTALEKLYSAFERKGISGAMGGKLMPT